MRELIKNYKYGTLKKLGEFKQYILYVENENHYFIKNLTENYVGMSGTKEHLLNELIRWRNEIDSKNVYMQEIEDYFINILSI